MLSLLSILAAEGDNGRFIPADPKEFFWSAGAFPVSYTHLTLPTKA